MKRRAFLGAVGAGAVVSVSGNASANHGLPDDISTEDIALLPGGTPTIEITGDNARVDHTEWREIRAMTGAADARFLPDEKDLYANFHMMLKTESNGETIECRLVIGAGHAKPSKANTISWSGDWQMVCSGWKKIEVVPTDKLIGFIGIDARISGGVGYVSETKMTMHIIGI